MFESEGKCEYISVKSESESECVRMCECDWKNERGCLRVWKMTLIPYSIILIIFPQ